MKHSNDLYSILYHATLITSMLNMLRVYSLLVFYQITTVKYLLLLSSYGLSVVLFVFSLSRYKGKERSLLFLMLLILLVLGYNSDYYAIVWFTFVLVIGAKGVYFRDIVKIHFIVSLCFCMMNMIGYKMGWLVQANNYSDGIREGLMGDWVQRYDFGYGWATDYANHVFFILLDWWILQRGRLNILGYVLFLYMPYFVIVYTDSRLAAGCILLLLLASLYIKWKDKRNGQMSRFTKWCVIVSLPLFAFISIYATMAYDERNLFWFAANLLVSNRLGHGSDALYEFGIPWVGQPVEMHGAIDAGGLAEYNFVDCIYVQYLIRFGFFFLGILIYMYMKMAIKAARRDDMVFLIAILIVGFSGVIAQYAFDFKFCVLPLALLVAHEQFNHCNYENSTLKPSVRQQLRRKPATVRIDESPSGHGA